MRLKSILALPMDAIVCELIRAQTGEILNPEFCTFEYSHTGQTTLGVVITAKPNNLVFTGSKTIFVTKVRLSDYLPHSLYLDIPDFTENDVIAFLKNSHGIPLEPGSFRHVDNTLLVTRLHETAVELITTNFCKLWVGNNRIVLNTPR